MTVYITIPFIVEMPLRTHFIIKGGNQNTFKLLPHIAIDQACVAISFDLADGIWTLCTETVKFHVCMRKEETVL